MLQNHISFLKSLFGEPEESRRKIFKSFKAKADAKRTIIEKLADGMTSVFGSINFLIINIVFLTLWLLINTDHIRAIASFDPFPFILLTMIASVGAIFMTIVILISQNRQAYINTLRSELLLQMILISERELTKALRLLARQAGASRRTKALDRELSEMLKDTDVSGIERTLAKQLRNDIAS